MTKGAEKKQEQETNIELKATDSLTPLLEEDAKKYMVGHPAEEPPEAKDEDGEEEEEKEVPKEEPEPEPKPEDKKVKEPAKPKYKSQEDAEKAYEEAQKKMHEATSEAARLREQNEKLQAQFNEVIAKAVTKKEDGEKTELTKKEEAILKGRIAPMLKDIESLDTESHDYQEKVDDIYEKHLGKAIGDVLSSREQAINERLSKLKDEIKKEFKEERSTEKSQEDVINDAIKKAKDAGLDMRTGIRIDGRSKPVDSADWRLFWDATKDAPEGSTPDEIVDFAIQEVKRMKEDDPLRKTRRKAREAQERNAVLERTTTGREALSEDETAKPLSMSEALNKTMRRI